MWWPHLEPSHLPDLLHLAVNSQKADMAEHLLQMLQPCQPQQETQQLPSEQHQLPGGARLDLLFPEVKQRTAEQQQLDRELVLRVTAHMREQRLLLQRQQQLGQQLSSSLVVELLHTAVVRGHWAVVDKLCKVEAAQQVAADKVGQLLLTVIRSQQTQGLASIFSLPAVKGQSAKTVYGLMQSAAQFKYEAAWEHLLQLPAAKQISEKDVKRLLLKAIQYQDSTAVAAICQLEDASRISSGDIASLVKFAIDQSFPSAICSIVTLPEAQMMTAAQIAALSFDAIDSSTVMEALEKLLQLPAAEHISVMSFHSLCRRALLINTNNNVLFTLLNLPAAEELPGFPWVGRLLQLALLQAKQDPAHTLDSISAIVQLPGAQDIAGVQLHQFIDELLQMRNSDAVVGELCSLAAAQQLTAAAVSQLAMKALRLERAEAAYYIAALPGMQGINKDQLSEAIRMAINDYAEDLGAKLCALPAAQGLSCYQIVSLLQAATDNRMCVLIQLLLQLPASHVMEAADLCELLYQELQLGCETECGCADINCILGFYCEHPVAATMSSYHIARLLRAAVQQQLGEAVYELCLLPGAVDNAMVDHIVSVFHQSLQPDRTRVNPGVIVMWRSDPSCMRHICCLPAAQALPVRQLQPLMLAAIRGGITQLLSGLCELPSAAALGRLDVVDLLKAALECDVPLLVKCMMNTVLNLPGAQSITRQDLNDLLKVAIIGSGPGVADILDNWVSDSTSSGTCITWGCVPSSNGTHSVKPATKLGLLVADQLDKVDVASLLLLGLQACRDAEKCLSNIKALSKLPAAKSLKVTQMHQLLRTAIQAGKGAEVQVLCDLHAMSSVQLSYDQVEELCAASENCGCPARADIMQSLSRFQVRSCTTGVISDLLII